MVRWLPQASRTGAREGKRLNFIIYISSYIINVCVCVCITLNFSRRKLFMESFLGTDCPLLFSILLFQMIDFQNMARWNLYSLMDQRKFKV